MIQRYLGRGVRLWVHDDWKEEQHKRKSRGEGGGQFTHAGHDSRAQAQPGRRRRDRGRARGTEEAGGGTHPGHGYSEGAHVDQKGVIHTTEVGTRSGRSEGAGRPRPAAPGGDLVSKLAAVAKRMERLGLNAPNFDLCNVAVENTNLFCAEGKGIPRVQMPQLPDEKGPAFQKFLADKGIKSVETSENASYLRATQSELVGVKVSGIMGFFRNKDPASDPPLFVSKDNYIVDGHHRWAARGARLEGEKEVPVNIVRVDMPIIELLAEAETFTRARATSGHRARSPPVYRYLGQRVHFWLDLSKEGGRKRSIPAGSRGIRGNSDPAAVVAAKLRRRARKGRKSRRHPNPRRSRKRALRRPQRLPRALQREPRARCRRWFRTRRSWARRAPWRARICGRRVCPKSRPGRRRPS